MSVDWRRDYTALHAERDALAAEVERLREIERTAREFVATTSVFRLHRESRPEFEMLVVALAAHPSRDEETS